ncbi:hypothetical protein EOD39_17421 [Acipenser ruthenus]|uniref:Uncharacterized protein n=1 Tax=Acipenser ruthenus TaxID=7906 RepID=A0A444V3G3_ACIRT|nr:hypothetical protein EOD39_17421 [Acipenser ruthenus]
MDPIPRRRRNSIQGFPPNLSEDHDRVLNCFQGKLTRGLSLKICPAPDDELDGVIMAKRREVIEETNKFYKEFDGWFKEENPLIAGHLAGFADKLDKVIMKDTMAMQRLMSLYEDTASDSEQERYNMTPILLSAPKRVSRGASGKRYSGEAAFGDVGPHQHQHQLQHQQCMLVKAF